MAKRSRSNSISTTVVKRTRTTPRASTRRKRTMSIQRMSLQGQPIQKVVKLRYTQNNGLDPAAGTTHLIGFRANSIYDPDYTGGGGQPSGHDQWAQFYNHYVVMSAKITCVFTNISTGSPTVGVAIRDEVPTPNGKALIENGHCRWRVLGASTSGRSQAKISMNVNIRKFLNLKTFDDDNIGSPFGSNPVEGVFFIPFAYHGDPATNAEPVYCETFIEYLVKLREPKTLAQS